MSLNEDSTSCKPCNITIVFKNSKSKSLETVIDLCVNFECFYRNENNILELNKKEFFEKYEIIQNILYIVGAWKGTKYFLNNNQVERYMLDRIYEILKCENDCDNCVDKQNYCKCGEGWGCKHINCIVLRNRDNIFQNPFWYDFGEFYDGKWIIDYRKLLLTISNNAEEKKLIYCNNFSIDRIADNIKQLPKWIEVSEDNNCDWQYKYEIAPIGIKPNKIIGIMPRKKESVVEKFMKFTRQEITLIDIFRKVPEVGKFEIITKVINTYNEYFEKGYEEKEDL